MTDTTNTSAIEQALTEHWGERCPDTEPGCPCCDAWAEYDALQAQLAEARNAALGDAWDRAESEILDFPFDEGTDQEAMLERVERAIRALKPEPAPRHPDDEAVDRFAAAMKSKLSVKREDGRGGWDDKTQCSQQFLSDLLIGHVDKGDPVDVANFAMMLHQRGEAIATAPRAVSVQEAAKVLPSAVKALASYSQGDMDGVMVLVSRQAIEECLPALRALAQEEMGDE